MPSGEPIGTVAALFRYPVKSMLGERLAEAAVGERGLAGDRARAVVDVATGRVASAKAPRRWKAMLACAAAGAGADTRVTLPGGDELGADDPRLADRLGDLLGRPVAVRETAAPGTELERAVPESVLRDGVDAEVEAVTLEIGAEAPAGTFFDFAAVHLITRASLERIGALHPAGAVDVVRYRPNLVLDLPGLDAFAEDAWPGRTLTLGDGVRLEVLIPTPRCAIPTLAHGALPRDPDAYRVVAAHHRVSIEGDELACAGAYARVIGGGRLREGDPVRLG